MKTTIDLKLPPVEQSQLLADLSVEQTGKLLTMITSDNTSGVTVALPEGVTLDRIATVVIVSQRDGSSKLTVRLKPVPPAPLVK